MDTVKTSSMSAVTGYKKLKQLSLGLLSLCLTISVSATVWTYTENDSGTNIIALGYPVPTPVDSLTPVDGFRSYASLYARHQDLMLNNPWITGTIVGNTINNRDIWAYEFSDSDTVTVEGFIPEGAVMQNGGIHAREWSTPEVTTGLMERLAGNSDDAWVYQYLQENLNIIILPVNNVDGFLQTQRYYNQALATTYPADPPSWPRDGRLRRKNMRNVDEVLTSESDGLLGIDLNRNNDPYWATSNRSSFDNGSLVYHGTGPASEPETQALHAAAQLANGQLRFYIDTHSFSQLWFSGNTNNPRRNAVHARIGSVMRAVTNFRYQLPTPGPANSGIGATDEYFAETFDIPSFTLETEPANSATQYGGFGVSHDGFILPESEIARVREETGDTSTIAWYMQAGPAAVIAVDITDTDSNNLVYSARWQATSATSRELVETVNDGLSANGNYQIWVAYNKPMRWLDDNDQIIQMQSLTTTLAPEFDIEGLDEAGDTFSQTVTGLRSDWLTAPGGPGVGYLNYKTDAFMLNFSLDASIDPSSATLLALAFANQDISGQVNDASPASVARWNGRWDGYEGSDGTFTDVGGVDRTLRIIDDGSAGFQEPGGSSGGGGSTPPPSSSGGGGGGSMPLGLLFLGMLWLGFLVICRTIRIRK